MRSISFAVCGVTPFHAISVASHVTLHVALRLANRLKKRVYVHDLNQFVTVHLLEETPAVLSVGKLCKDHGYSHEWVSGQKPRLTKNGKSVICKTDNFVPLVVPRLSVNSESCSSTTTTSPESLGPEASPASGNRASASSSSDAVVGRSDETSSGKLGQESWESDKKDKNDPLAEMPFWLQDFKDNLIPTEVPSPAHFSQDSDSEHSTKVATMSRKHSMFTHFPKDRNCDVCLVTKVAKASCRRRTGEASPRAEKFGDLITADRKVHEEECESRDNLQYAVVVQDLATVNLIRVKQNLKMRRKEAYYNYWSQRRNHKSFIMTIPLNLAKSQAPTVVCSDNSMELGKACEDLSWNHRTSTTHRSETNGIAERAVRRDCYSQDSMKSGGQIPWNTFVICEMSKTSWQTGKQCTKDDLKNHSKDQ